MNEITDSMPDPNLPANDAEAHAELEAMQVQLRGSVTSQAARVCRLRARKLARHFHTSVVAQLAESVENMASRVLRQGPRLTRRCKAFAQELDNVRVVTSKSILEGLRSAGFGPDTPLGTEEATALWNLLWSALKPLASRYRAADFPEDNLGPALDGLENLERQVPTSLQRAHNFLRELRDELEQRRGAYRSRRDLQSLLDRMTELAEKDIDWAAGTAEREAMERMLQVSEALLSVRNLRAEDEQRQQRKLHGQLRIRLDRLLRFTDLPGVVDTHLSNGEFALAIDQLHDAAEEAAEAGSSTAAPLVESAGAVVEAVSGFLRSSVGESSDPASLESDLAELQRAEGWAKRIPRDLGGSALVDLTARIEELSRDKVARLRSARQKAERDYFLALDRTQLGEYLRRLESDNLVGLELWIRKLGQLHADLEAISTVTEGVPRDCLERLRGAPDELGEGRITGQARQLAHDFESAQAELEKIRAEISGTASSAALAGRVREIRKQFPSWQFPAQVQGELHHRELLGSIHRHLESPSVDALEAARAEIREIGEKELREKYEQPLARLLSAFSALAGFASSTEIEPGDRLDRAVRGAQLARNVCSEWEEWELRERFAKARAKLDEEVLRAVQTDLPPVIESWLEREASAAPDRNQLLRLRERFEGWSRILGDPQLEEDAERQFESRNLELQLEEWMEAGNYEGALGELDDRETLLSAEAARSWRTRLLRTRAMADYREGRDPQLAGIARVIREVGESPALMSVLVEDFEQRGDPAALAGLVSDRTVGEEWSIAPLARSCELLHTGKTLELSRMLAESPVESFLKGVPHAAKGQAVAAAALKIALGEAQSWSATYRRRVESTLRRLLQSIGEKADQIRAGLQSMEDQLDAPAPSEEVEDAKLMEAIQEAFSRARRDLGKSLSQLREWSEWLTSIRSQAEYVEEFESLKELLRKTVEFRTRVESGKEALLHLEKARVRMLEDESATYEVLSTAVMRVRVKKPGPVMGVSRLLLHYYRDWEAVKDIVDELVEANQQEGENITLGELQFLERKLREKHGYVLAPGHDRYRFLDRLGGKNYSTFMEDLEEMAREWDAISELELCKNRVQQAVRLPRLVREYRRHGYPVIVEDLRTLLEDTGFGGKSMLQIYRDIPAFSASRKARARMNEILNTKWFRLMAEAADIVESHG